MNRFLKTLIPTNSPNRAGQIPLKDIYTESLMINWAVSSQNFLFQNRYVDRVLGSEVQADC
ncbi:MAG: hypothetical protein FWH57_01840 [Oscillospiraceae bacterium]|nr:hypothetical protein [Oscillospiraceae bacterium]